MLTGKKLRRLLKLRKLEAYLVTSVTVTVCNLHTFTFSVSLSEGFFSTEIKKTDLQASADRHVGNEKCCDVFIV